MRDACVCVCMRACVYVCVCAKSSMQVNADRRRLIMMHLAKMSDNTRICNYEMYHFVVNLQVFGTIVR